MAMHLDLQNRAAFLAPWHKENGGKKYGMEEEVLNFSVFSFTENNIISDEENDHHEI